MRRTNLATLLGALTALACLGATGRVTTDADGEWNWKLKTTNGQDVKFTALLRQSGEKLTGIVFAPDRVRADIEFGSFKDGTVTFTVFFDHFGDRIAHSYRGKVEGDTITGRVESQRDGMTSFVDWEADRERRIIHAPNRLTSRRGQ